METLSKNTALYSSTFENFIFSYNLDAEVEYTASKDFCSLYSLSSMVNKPTCWKNPSQHFNVGSTLFQRCRSTLKQH